MAVQCPYCRHELPVKTAPPGMYTTACPDCGRSFTWPFPKILDNRRWLRRFRRNVSRVRALPGSRRGLRWRFRPEGARVESKAADGPLLTLPEHAQSAATPAGSPIPTKGAGDEPAERALPTPGFSWSSLRVGSVPRLLDSYLVLQELGRTALGPVNIARRLWLNRIVNLNVMKLLWARNAPFVARFTREAYAAIQLHHHNLAQLLDFGEAKGTTYFCTEHVEGQNLAELVGQKKRLRAEEAAGYVFRRRAGSGMPMTRA